MAFTSKFGNLLKQTLNNHIKAESPASNLSMYQLVRFMSSSKLFVGGLSYNTDDWSLKQAFSNYGEVIEARVITDRETGRSRGFGFVTFCSSEEASAAISAMDGKDLNGRMVRVNYATDRPRGFSGGYGGGNFGGGGGYSGGGGGYGGGGYGAGGGGGYGAGGGGGYSGGGGGYGGGSGVGNYSGGVGYGSGGTGDRGGGDVFGSGGVGSGTYGGSVAGGYDNVGGSHGVAAGGGGSDNFVSTANVDSYTSGEGTIGYENNGGMNYENADSSHSNSGSMKAGQDEALEGNFRDNDDEPDDYANKRD